MQELRMPESGLAQTDAVGDGPPAGVAAAPRYRAFISYSHSDERWARWLHRALEGYRVPRRLRGRHGEFGPLPERLTPIFRDREDLASAGELGPRIQAALQESAALIVICSPEAARSRWVNEEILSFKRAGRGDRIYCLIVDGAPHSGDERECFPSALRFALGADGTPGTEAVEPLAADLRPGKDGKTLARLKLLSGLLGVDLDQLRQREAQRRNRRMAAITVLALVVMLVTSYLAVQAMIAQRSAERRQKQAESLVNFMLGDLNDKLTQVQRLDIMEAVDDQAMRYFLSLPTTDVTDEALAQRAKALVKIGSIRLDQGDLSAAMESYQAALKIAALLAERAPADLARQLSHAEILAFTGTTHWFAGELEPAQRAFESAQGVLRHAQRYAPRNSQLLYQLATLDNNIGHVLETRGRLEDAARQYQDMLALCQQLVAVEPGNPDWQVQLGLAHNNLGKLALMHGDLGVAVSEYVADDAIESALAARDPKDYYQQEKVAITRAILGRTLALTGDVPMGIGYLQQAVALVTQLSAVDPSNTGFQEDVGLYSTQLARLHRLNGDLATAQQLGARASAIFLALTQREPANKGWQRALAEAQLEQAEQSRAAGVAAEADSQARAALARLEPLSAAQPDDRATLLAAAAARLLLAAVSDDASAASQWREAALRLVEGKGGAGSEDPRLLALRAEALLALQRKAQARPVIKQLWASGYRDPALLVLLAGAGIDYPVNAQFQTRLAAATGKK